MRVSLILTLFIWASLSPAFSCEKGAEAIATVYRKIDRRVERFPLRPEKLRAQLEEVKDAIPKNKSLSSSDEAKIAKFLDDAHNKGPIKTEMEYFQRREELGQMLKNLGHLNPDEILDSVFRRTFKQRHIGNENTFRHTLNEETSDFITSSGYKQNSPSLNKAIANVDEGKPIPQGVKDDIEELVRDVNDYELTSMRNSFSQMKDKSNSSKEWMEGYFTDVSKREIARDPSLNPYKASIDPASVKSRDPDVITFKLEGSDRGHGSFEFVLKKGDTEFVYVRDVKTGLEFPIKDERVRGILRGRAYREWAVLNPKEARVRNVGIIQKELENEVHLRNAMDSALGRARDMAASDVQRSSQVLSNVSELQSEGNDLKKLLDDDVQDWQIKDSLRKFRDLFESL